MHVDFQGGVFYADSFPLPAEAPASPPGGDPEISATVPVSPFPSHLIFHSRPGAPNVLYLDFDGEDVTGTAWNASLGRDPIPAVPFSTDGDRNSFSDADQAGIKSIWQRVAEDYAPFDIDVTTERPASFNNRTDHALITRNTDANGQPTPTHQYGGIAYINVFGSGGYGYYRPSWIADVWNALVPSYISETVSHETGHEMGLAHDGPGYHTGHGSGDISWGPLMGSSWAKNVSQWCRGEYYGASNGQDDLAIIAGKLGWRADDHVDTLAGATALEMGPDGSITSTTPETDPTNSNPANKGVIEHAGDADLFTFGTGAGELQLTVEPWINPTSYRGGNLDVLFELLDESGATLATADLPSTTYATLTIALPAGLYYLRVTGTGTGDPFSSSPTGYTDYGSIGQYFISGQLEAFLPPEVNNGTGATGITHTTAWATGELISHGAMTEICVQFGSQQGSARTCVVDVAEGSFSVQLRDLVPETDYVYRCSASNIGGVVSSAGAAWFRTLAELNVTTSLGATGVTHRSAWLTADVQNTAGEPTSVCFHYGNEHGDAFESCMTVSTDGLAEVYVTNLLAETAYAYRCRASGVTGALWSDGSQFFSTPAALAVNNDLGATGVTHRSAWLTADVDNTLGEPTLVCFHLGNEHGDMSETCTTVFADGLVEAYVTNLLAETAYAYRCRAAGVNGDLWTDGFHFFDTPAPAAFVDDDADGMDDNWEILYLGSTTNSAGGTNDCDGDGFIDVFEFLAGTHPMDPESLLAINGVGPVTPASADLTWYSSSNRSYSILFNTNVPASWDVVASNITATPPVNTQQVLSGPGSFFYRIRLDP